MAHCYVVTAQPATSIIGSIVCNFTSPNSRDLIITKGNHLEVHCLSASSDGKTPVLHHFIDATMHGKIVSIDKYTPQNNSQQDSLFILTERKNFCILSYDNSTKKLITNCNGNVKDRIGREIETGICGLLDNQHNIIAMMVYEGLIKIFPIDPITNVIKESYNLRLEEIRYLDVKFLYGYSKPTFAILYEDARLNKHIKTYSIDVREKELLDGPWNQMYVDKSSIFLIPIPSPPSINGFCILVGIHTISYITGVGKGNAASNSVSILTNTTGGAGGLRIISYGIVDPDGSRFLLGDIHGNLHILALKREVSHVGAGCSNPVVVGLSLDTLGITSVANGISYLDKGIVYISSRFGDSQLIKILPDKIMSTEAGSGSNNHVQVLDVHTNIGPIVDMVVVNHDTKSTESSTTGDCNSLVEVDSNVTGASAQSQVVTCSGAYKDGSIRIIKSGIGFQEQAELEIPGIKGMWSLISSNTTSGKEVFDKYLVQSFISETRILSIDNEEMEECEIPGFNSEESTLFCTDICKNSAWMQVTPTTIRMVDNKSMCLIFSLRSDSYDGAVEGERFALATANQEQVVVSTTNSKLLYFEVVVEGDAMGTLQLTGVIPLEVDVACMSIRPPIYSSSSIETSDSSSDMEVDVSAPNVSSAMPPPPPIVDVHTNRKDSLIASQTSRAGASRSHSSYVGSVRSNTGVHDMICPLGKANILAVGLWTEPSSVRLFSLPNLEEVSRVNLNNTTGGNTSTNTVQVRDVLLLELGPSLVVLLAGMGDGTLISHVVERGYRDVHSVSMADNTKNNHIELSSKRCVTLGSQPISLSCFCNNGILCVLAACDRPTVIYQQNNKLLFSIANINSSAGSAGGQISGVASFHTELFPEALALASASAGLSISTVGEIKKIHVQKYALNASPRRICHCSDFDLYVVLTQKMETNSAGVDITSENVVFLRETSSGGGEIMEQIHVHALDHMESGLSVVCTSFHSSNNDSSTKQYIVVGTAQSIVGEVEPSRGRMLVFDLNRTPGAKDGVGDIGISCIYEKEVKGAVFSLASIKGRLIAGIGSKVQIFKYNCFNLRFELKLECSHYGHILALFIKCKNDMILVGDLLRSITVLKYSLPSSDGSDKPESGSITEIARDFNVNAMRSVEFFYNDNYYLGAEDFGNMFVARRQVENVNSLAETQSSSISNEERSRLVINAEYHLGDTINVYRCGSLNSQPVDTVTPATKASAENTDSSESATRNPYQSVLYGTIGGAIGAIIAISKENFEFLEKLEKSIQSVIQGLGGFSHHEYRSFYNGRRSNANGHSIDGDLIESFLVLSTEEMNLIVNHLNDTYLMQACTSLKKKEDKSGISNAILNGDLWFERGGAHLYTVEDVISRIEDMIRLH